MLDVYRFILAIFVVQGHLLAWGPAWLAWQAVISFYVLSGFLMTLILNENYGFGPRAFGRFVINRVLRLFPSYYMVIGISAAYIILVGPLSQLHNVIALPQTIGEWAANLSIIGLAGFDSADQASHRLSPPAWSLAIELFSYVLLAIGFARSERRLAVLLVVGIAIAGWQMRGKLHPPDYDFQNHYGVLQAGLIPFALGGLAYFWRRHPVFTYSGGSASTLALLFAANVAVGYFSDFHKYVSGLYVAAVLNMMIVPILFSRPITQTWARMLGGVAYPVFISHWLVGTLLAIYFPIAPRSFTYFIAASMATVLLSLLLYVWIDRPVDRLRGRIKLSLQHRAMPEPKIVSQLP